MDGFLSGVRVTQPYATGLTTASCSGASIRL